MTDVMSEKTRFVLIGMIAPIAIIVPLIALGAQFCPNSPLLGTLVRMLESAAPQLLVISLPFVAATALLGARRLALAILLVILTGSGGLILQHRAMSQPVEAAASSDLTVLWYNMLWTNPTDPKRMAEALMVSGADIVLLAEPRQVRTTRALLAETYPYQIGCEDKCNMAALSRVPFSVIARLRPGPLSEERIMVLELTLPGHAPVTVAAMHLIKPWYFGLTEMELDSALTTLRKINGPQIVVGDFNSAPWSQRMRTIVNSTGLALPRLPIPSWPAQAGAFAVPIDHVMVKDGPVLHSLRPWGHGLGSDHRGLLAEISLPPAP